MQLPGMYEFKYASAKASCVICEHNSCQLHATIELLMNEKVGLLVCVLLPFVTNAVLSVKTPTDACRDSADTFDPSALAKQHAGHEGVCTAFRTLDAARH